jgi:two-component system, NarL family, sensor histidine kinase FusK
MSSVLPKTSFSMPPISVAAGFLLLHVLLGFYGFFHWNLAYGLLFGTYWFRPRNEWWAYALLSILANMAQSAAVSIQTFHDPVALFMQRSWLLTFIGNVPQAFIGMVGVQMLLKRGISPEKASKLAQMSLLHLAALATAALYTLKDLWYVFTEGSVGDVRRGVIVDMQAIIFPDSLPELAKFALSHFMGAFLGIMLVVPMAMWVFVPNHHPGSKRISNAALIYLYLLPVLLFLGNASLINPSSSLVAMLKILLLAAVVVFSFSHGWRGAAVSVLVVSILIGVYDHLNSGNTDVIELQLYVAVMGAMALLFGASVDELKKNESALQIDKDKLQKALVALADSTRRGMQSEELERKRLARELHDDMGQILTAMQTQISLSQQHSDDQNHPESSQSLEHLAQKMTTSLKSVVNALSPDELNQLGLYTAITFGSPAQLCEMSHIHYQVELQGNSLLLDELEPVTSLAAYRIVQESVSNAVKYASCRTVWVRLHIGWRQEKIHLFISIADDGIGLKSLGQIRYGFHSIRDRAVALNGVLHVHNLPGVRVHVLLRQ